MNDYSQPSFYRFNEDSLKLVKFVFSKIKSSQAVLDLAAGCGVLGIEISNLFSPQHLTLLELQEDYLPHLKINIEKQMTLPCETKIIISSFGNWVPSRKFDLIVCNPPYFLIGHGEENADSRKYKARSFVIDNWAVLLEKIEEGLTSDGHAFIVLKNDLTLVQMIKKNSNLNVAVTKADKILFLELSRLNKNRDEYHL